MDQLHEVYLLIVNVCVQMPHETFVEQNVETYSRAGALSPLLNAKLDAKIFAQKKKLPQVSECLVGGSARMVGGANSVVFPTIYSICSNSY